MLLSKEDKEKFAKQYPYFTKPVLMYLYKMNDNQYKMYVRVAKLGKSGVKKILRLSEKKALYIINSHETCEELAERLGLDKELILKFRELL